MTPSHDAEPGNSVHMTSSHTSHHRLPQYECKYPLEGDFDVELAEGSRDSPGVRLLVFIVQRFNLLRFLGFAEPCRVVELEELRSKLDEPLGVDGRDLAHVLLGGEHQLVVHDPAATE